MDAILNNPFRILGLSTTSSDKEIAKRVSDLLIYAEMGKKVSYETDLPFIGELDRSVEAIKLASKRVELAENKIFYSLLWFDFKDNIEKESLEFLKNGEYKAAINVLEKEIFNISPIVYSFDQRVTNILKYFKTKLYINNYALTIGPSKSLIESSITTIRNNFFINIFKEDGSVEIQEGKCEINLTDKFQVACKFKWLESYTGKDVCIELGFIDKNNSKYSIRISKKGTFSFYMSDELQIESDYDITIIEENESNYLALKKYDNFIEAIFNGLSIYKMQNLESFNFSFINFLGKQRLLIEDLSISTLKHKKILGFDDEINEVTFSYTKNISLVYLIEILRIGNVGSGLFSYFHIVGNLLKKPYFINYTKKIVSDTYSINFEVLFDIFIREFYSSLHHLIDDNQEYSSLLFYNSFAKLSESSEKKVLDKLKGSKPYIFENFIKDISQKRNENHKNFKELAYELKNEATYFFKWYSNFYSGNLESEIISNKVGNEILECAIAFYNATTPKSGEIAKESLKIMNWASDFAFNQVLRDRINNNISVLIKTHRITEYNIIDFDLKDKIRLTAHIIKKDESSQNNPTNKFLQKTSTTHSKQTENKTNGNTDQKQNQRKSSNKLNLKNAFGILIFVLLIPMLFVVFSPDKKKEASSRNNQIKNSKTITNNNKNYLATKEKSRWAGNSLQNGSSPYDGIFGKGIYDYDSKCWLTFKNGNSTDAIVCLESISTGRTIRNEYIQAGTDYQMTNIPEGVYMVKVFNGNNWNPEKRMDDGTIIGAFETDQSFSLSDKPDDFIRIKITETYNGVSYTTGEITLYTVSNGNMNQRIIDGDEFFN